MLSTIIISLVDNSRRMAWPVIALACMLGLGCGYFAATHFKMNTDVNGLLAAELPWRQQERAFADAFPQKNDQLVIVVDGKTATDTEAATDQLAEKLRALTDRLKSVTRPEAIPFFRQHGLLYLSKDELGDTLDRLTEAQNAWLPKVKRPRRSLRKMWTGRDSTRE